MLSKFISQLQKYYQSTNAAVVNFLKDAYPINFPNLLKLKLVGASLVKSSPQIKIFLGLFVAGLLSSVIFLSSGIYLVATEDTPVVGGEAREVVLNGSIQKLNPVLETSSEAEKKINTLLFHPLYYVNYPDYLTESKDPEIEPVLLEKAPEWQNDKNNPQNNYKILKFKLNKAKWCDGSQITTDDIIYSFNRLKEEGGNAEFNAIFQDYEAQAVVGSSTEFVIQPNRVGVAPNPQLLYSANFSPISKNFYQNAKNAELKSSFRSLQPANSSGFYCLPTKINNPEGGRNQVDNPYREELEDYSQVVLKRNPNSVYKKDAYIETYNFRFVRNLKDTATSQESLEKLVKDQKVDLFTRFLTPPNANTAPLSKFDNLTTTVVPTNTFFNLYLNAQGSSNNFDGYLINQVLRNYIACSFIDYQLPKNLSQVVDPVPTENRLVPIQFNEKYTPNCSDIEARLLDLKNSRGSQIYTIDNDTRSNVKQVRVFNSNIVLTILFLDEFSDFAVTVQNRFKEIGLPVNSIVTSSSNLNQKLAEKQYHIAFLPISIQGKNPYSLFGKSGKDISSISQNERLGGSVVEDNLKLYSQSNLTDETAKVNLITFFKEQFITLNLFRGKQEINYSTRVKNINTNLPKNYIMVSDLYHFLPYWYTETTRKLKF